MKKYFRPFIQGAGFAYFPGFASRAALLLAACLFCASAQAECSREDVDYYLAKGFTHEQVAALCGGGVSRERNEGYQGYEDPVERRSQEEEARRRREEEIYFLKSALNAWDVELTPKKLEYTRKFCLAAGKTPEVEGRTRVCPDVRYRIYFKGLEVLGFERKYWVLGRREIEVKGNVKRKMLHDLREYSSDLRRELLGAYRHATRKGATFIPVRRDVPIYRVVDILRKYARPAS